jgi:hypothetical protein
LIVGLQLGKYALLTAPAIVIGHYPGGACSFVGQYHLEVIPIGKRQKQIQLYRLLVLNLAGLAYKYQPVTSFAGFRFPALFESNRPNKTVIALTALVLFPPFPVGLR